MEAFDEAVSLSTSFFDMCVDEVIRKWLIELTSNFHINDTKINSVLLADVHVIITDNEHDLHRTNIQVKLSS
jgi:hypothetical protein